MKRGVWGWLLITAMLCAAVVSSGLADTLLVPSQYATIQAAIDAAVAGNEVGDCDLDWTIDLVSLKSAAVAAKGGQVGS